MSEMLQQQQPDEKAGEDGHSDRCAEPSEEDATGFNQDTIDDDTIIVVDLFCGLGGFSAGARKAAEKLGLDVIHIAVNHDEDAITSYRSNFDDAHIYHEKMQRLTPRAVIEEVTGDYTTQVDLLLAGPECRTFSPARGGAEVKESNREPAWEVLSWLTEVDVRRYIVENVPAIKSWGSVDGDTPSRDGTVYNAWTNSMNDVGYTIDTNVIRADDYGDPTMRERWFLIGNKYGGVSFPDPTHSDTDDSLPDRRKAASVIDWRDEGTSIWSRDITEPGVHTPPAGNTVNRIADGVSRHCEGTQNGEFATLLSTFDPEKIQTLRSKHVYTLSEAAYRFNGAGPDDPEDYFFVKAADTHRETQAEQAMVVRQQSGAYPINPHEETMPTIATSGAHQLATVKAERLSLPDEDDHSGAAEAAPPEVELSNLVLCTPESFPVGLDVRIRLLKEAELKQAQGFDPDFVVKGDNKAARKRQIGNAIPRHMAEALCEHVLLMDVPSLGSYGGGITDAGDSSVPSYADVE